MNFLTEDRSAVSTSDLLVAITSEEMGRKAEAMAFPIPLLPAITIDFTTSRPLALTPLPFCHCQLQEQDVLTYQHDWEGPLG